jgi:hypothetical protein
MQYKNACIKVRGRRLPSRQREQTAKIWVGANFGCLQYLSKNLNAPKEGAKF